MKRGIHISRIWSDDDLFELKVAVFDGTSCFVNQVYVGQTDFTIAITNLDGFKTHVHGGVCDLRFGAFGCEFANGAFHTRLHFWKPGKLFITCHQESDFFEFGKKTVASSATLYLISEPALLDRFIVDLRRVAKDPTGEAFLEAV
jgi:hypothetical protein